jgi:NADPH:quinone reductase-like Zn-dependent oxidoreductase
LGGLTLTSFRSSLIPENKALWLAAKRAPFTIGSAPYTVPGVNEIVVRVRAVAVNPFDYAIQSMGSIITPWIPYPFIVGSDLAGVVVEVGSLVTRFRVGDRVLGYAAGSDKRRNRAAEGAFQDYAVVLAHMAAPIPDTMSFEQAAVLPLGLSTAACGLFQRDFLAMNAPSAAPAQTSQALLVWGGSTSVGANAIQLAVAAGYDVVTTASPHNFGYVRALGAFAAFDYRSKTVIPEILSALQGRGLVGALAIGLGSATPCVEIVAACAAYRGRRFVALATPEASFDQVPTGRGRLRRLAPAIAQMVAGNIKLGLQTRRRGVSTKFIWGSDLIANEVGPMIFETYLPAALAEGRYVAAPSPTVVGAGLAQIPIALERLRQGVSATKLVVTLNS